MQNEFEKKVQDQLTGFSVTPSDGVWLDIEKNMGAENRKKQLIIFWWTAAMLFILGGGLTWYVLNNEKNSITASTKNTSHKNIKTGESSKQNSNRVNGLVANQRANSTTEIKEKRKIVQQEKEAVAFATNKHNEAESSSPKTSAKEYNKGLDNNKRSTVSKVYRTNSLGYARPQIQQSISGRQDVSINAAKEKDVNSSAKSVKVEMPLARGEQNNIQKPEMPFAKIDKAGVHLEKSKEITETALDTLLPSSLTRVKIAAPTDSIISAILNTKKEDKKIKAGKWMFGLYVSAGIADNVSSLPFAENKKLNDAAYSTSPNSAGSSNALPVMQFNYTASFSGAMGAFVSRSISKRTGLSAGVNFHYYSVKTTTGNKVNIQRNVYDTLTGNSVALNEYYIPVGRNQANFGQSVSTFTNRYYFLQMPVNLTYSLNKKNAQSILISAGITPGFLLSSNTIYYNRLDRIAYVDKQQFKKFQLSAQAGISFSLINSKKYLLQAGPQFMAGLTNLSKPVYNSNQHLFYMGIGTHLSFK
ncbi:MAG: PorT family protein [Chitinophagaceae bacterium]|nr:PorT family protein [Chitinophagaceae bacterium]